MAEGDARLALQISRSDGTSRYFCACAILIIKCLTSTRKSIKTSFERARSGISRFRTNRRSPSRLCPTRRYTQSLNLRTKAPKCPAYGASPFSIPHLSTSVPFCFRSHNTHPRCSSSVFLAFLQLQVALMVSMYRVFF